jgi:hypothetical protein
VRDEAIAPTRNGLNVLTPDTFAQSLPQHANSLRKIGFFNHGIGPDALHQILLFDNVPGIFHQHEQER